MFKLVKAFPHLLLILSAMACLLVLPVHTRLQTSQVNPGTETESILFTVLDQDRRSVSNLMAEDVRIFESGKDREVVSLLHLEAQPLALAIVIDKSRSQESTLPFQKIAADTFVKQIMRPDKDQVTVVSFTGRATLEQGLTKDLALVRQAIARVKFEPPSGYIGGGTVIKMDPAILGLPKGSVITQGSSGLTQGSTALWDAISTTSEMLAASVGTSKAIILLSDGEDTFSKIKAGDAIERAVKADIGVYSIGIGDRRNHPGSRSGVNTDDLRKLSDRTGGRAFFPTNVKDLETEFAEIEQQLRSQYQVTYRTDERKGSKARKVRLEIVNPSLRGKDLLVCYQRESSAR
jgi:Ca-activated chloride channel family protein